MSLPVLIVLAAGIGSRYGGVKQIDPVGPNGEIVLDYSVYDALRAGFNKVIFVIRPELERAFRDHIATRFEHRIAVDYVFQELDTGLPPGLPVPATRKKPWGTGHAILACEQAVDGPFCVINADDFYGATAFAKLASFLADSPDQDYAMVGFRLQNTLSDHGTVSRGICEVAEGQLKRVVERTKIGRFAKGIAYEDKGVRFPLQGDELVSMNFWGFPSCLFSQLQKQFHEFLADNADIPTAEFFIPSVVDRLIQENGQRVHVLETPDRWFGVTYPEDKTFVVNNIRALIADGAYPEQLWTR